MSKIPSLMDPAYHIARKHGQTCRGLLTTTMLLKLKQLDSGFIMYIKLTTLQHPHHVSPKVRGGFKR